MNKFGRLAFLFGAGILGVACFVDNPSERTPDAGSLPASALDGGGSDGASLADDARAGDASRTPDADVDAGPSLCEKYGGYGTVEVVVQKLVGALVADCRVSHFFTTLAPDRVGHLQDCLVKQVAVVMHCPGIVYDVDNEGLDCRDMKTAHHGLSIRGADFDALIQDLVTVLTTAGVAQADVETLAPSLLALRSDIVTNSAPSHGHSVCTDGGNE